MRIRCTPCCRIGSPVTAAAVTAVGLLLAVAPAAQAIQVTPHAFASSFDGTGSTAGPFGTYSIDSVAVDEGTNDVYVYSGEQQALDKFNAAGNPLAFTAPGLSGATSLFFNGLEEGSFAREGQVAVDNFGTATRGRIYLSVEGPGWLLAIEPSGEKIGGNYPLKRIYAASIAPDPTSTTGNYWTVSESHGRFTPSVVQYSAAGLPTGSSLSTYAYLGEFGRGGGQPRSVAVDSHGDLYVKPYEGEVYKFNSAGAFEYTLDSNSSVADAVDPRTNNVYLLEYARESGKWQVAEYSEIGVKLATIPLPANKGFRSIAVNGTNGNVYVGGYQSANTVEIYAPASPITLPGPVTKPGSGFKPGRATLNATVSPEGVPTNDCHFEWGPTTAYGETVPCAQGNVHSGAGEESVSGEVTGLVKGTRYHYRLVVANSNGSLAGRDASFFASEAPKITNEFVSNVHADSVEFHANVDPEGAETSFHVEYGTAECSAEPQNCASSPDINVGGGLLAQSQSVQVKGLKEGTTYHYRVVATNQSETTKGAERTFTTFPLASTVNDPCPNAHVRQQTGAAQLLDCRAYELVSASNSGGYDVESNLVEGQTPFASYPEAESPSRVLYGVRDGGIPGTNHPTNRGVDPYVATRGENGWSTEYVGVPATNPFAKGPFSSSPSGADATLEDFAFGGPNGCSPCFEGGYTGIPVRLRDGRLVQGMVASAGIPVPPPIATADGYVAKDLSANGDHFIFGSTSRFAPGGNEGSGDVSIYDRNLKTNETQVVSDSPEGAGHPLKCLGGAGTCHSPGDANGIGELDISNNGSHIVLGQKVATDSAGNVYWHLYMNIGDSANTIDMTPGTKSGVLYDGMTADGSKVFFTTVDQLVTADEDHSADIYMWSSAGEAEGKPLALLSTGKEGTGNTDACEPAANWNTVSGGPNCNVVAVGGGGGVASGNGTIYFLSPELLDGPSNGVKNQPNLYVVRSGSAPHFVATIDSSVGKAPPPPNHHLTRTFGSFNVPSFVAVDRSGGPSNGDVYIGDTGTNTVQKFDATGHPITGWAKNGVLSEPFTALAGIAVDKSGTLDVLDTSGNVYEFGQETGALTKTVFLPGGAAPRGLAVDSAGNFYRVHSLEGRPGFVEKFNSTGHEIGTVTNPERFDAIGIGVDPATDDFYAVGGDGSIIRYAFSAGGQVIEAGGENCTVVPGGSFFSGGGCKPTSVLAMNLSGPAGVAFDPASRYVYVDLRNKIIQFDSTGNRLNTTWSGGNVTKSVALGVGPSGDVYATSIGSNHGEIAQFGSLPVPFPLIDNPLIVDSVQQAATRNTADFQVTRNGEFAVFASSLALTGYDNGGYPEVYRYDAATNELTCASCAATGARAKGDARLALNGLSVTDDGRVFFDSTNSIAPSALNEGKNVYEWEPKGTGAKPAICEESSLSFSKLSGGCLELISTGTSPFDSSLLGVSATGTDVYLFTRDTLVPQDQNGQRVKIYDARSLGGFPYVEPEVPCKASDECHGPGSPAPSPPNINTIKGSRGNVAPTAKCKRGSVARKGRCVRSSHHHHHHRRGKSKRHGRHRRRARALAVTHRGGRN